MSSARETPTTISAAATPSRLQGPLLLLGAALSFSVMSVLVKTAGARIPAMQVVLARSVVTLLLSYVMVRRAGIAPLGRQRKLLLLRALLGFIALSCYFTSLTRLPIAEATVIQYSNPVFVVVFAALFLRERTSRGVGIGIALCLAGVMLVARPLSLFDSGASGAAAAAAAAGAARGIDALSLLIALGGAVFSAGAYTTVRRLREESALVIVFYVPLVTTPLAIPFVIGNAVWPTATEWLVLVGVGVATQVSQLLFTRGLALVAAGRGTAIGYAQVVFSSVIGALVWREIPGAWTIGGALLIAVGTVLTIWNPTTTRAPA